jgi:hypothetical protein
VPLNDWQCFGLLADMWVVCCAETSQWLRHHQSHWDL